MYSRKGIFALLSSTFNDLREKTGRLTQAGRVGLKLNARKCKTLRTEHANNRESIVVNGREVEEFPCLGATVDKEGGGRYYEPSTEGSEGILEIRKRVGCERNRQENKDTPIQEFNSTGPAIWL